MRPLSLVPLVFLISACNQQKDILITNFESADYSGWEVAGEAFGSAPVSIFSEKQNIELKSSVEGNYYANSAYFKGDTAIGKLVSPPLYD